MHDTNAEHVAEELRAELFRRDAQIAKLRADYQVLLDKYEVTLATLWAYQVFAQHCKDRHQLPKRRCCPALTPES